VCIFCFPWFSVFSPYSSSSLGHFSFSRFSMSLAIFHVQHCVFLIFCDFQFYRHTPGPTVCIPHFPHLLVFRAIFQVIQCLFLIFHVFSVFLS
jgi:hypothetical protein